MLETNATLILHTIPDDGLIPHTWAQSAYLFERIVVLGDSPQAAALFGEKLTPMSDDLTGKALIADSSFHISPASIAKLLSRIGKYNAAGPVSDVMLWRQYAPLEKGSYSRTSLSRQSARVSDVKVETLDGRLFAVDIGKLAALGSIEAASLSKLGKLVVVPTCFTSKPEAVAKQPTFVLPPRSRGSKRFSMALGLDASANASLQKESRWRNEESRLWATAQAVEQDCGWVIEAPAGELDKYEEAASRFIEGDTRFDRFVSADGECQIWAADELGPHRQIAAPFVVDGCLVSIRGEGDASWWRDMLVGVGSEDSASGVTLHLSTEHKLANPQALYHLAAIVEQYNDDMPEAISLGHGAYLTRVPAFVAGECGEILTGEDDREIVPKDIGMGAFVTLGIDHPALLKSASESVGFDAEADNDFEAMKGYPSHLIYLARQVEDETHMRALLEAAERNSSPGDARASESLMLIDLVENAARVEVVSEHGSGRASAAASALLEAARA